MTTLLPPNPPLPRDRSENFASTFTMCSCDMRKNIDCEISTKKPKNRSSLGRTIVFKTTLNCSHARIKSAISSILPELDCIVCYKKTVTLANLCK